MKALTETDKKFVPGTVEERTYLFRDCREDPFRIYGLILPNEEDPFFTRMPRKVAETVSKDVLQLCPCTAGGRIHSKEEYIYTKSLAESAKRIAAVIYGI